MVLILGAGIAGRINGTTETPPLAFVVFGFAVLATTVAVSWRRADLRLWREGQAVAGELTKSYRKSSGSGESRTTHSYVRYRYTVEGVDYERRRRSKRVEEPRPIWVLHDPQKPGKSMPTW